MSDYKKITEGFISIPLEPYTIAFVFGAVQETAEHEQLAVVELVSKDLKTTEAKESLKGHKGQAYKVVDKRNKNIDDMSDHAVVYGPFEEEKTINIKLYWTYDNVCDGIGPDTIGKIDEFDDEKLRTKITLIPVVRKVQTLPPPPGSSETNVQSESVLEAVVNCTRMKIKA